MQFDEFFSDIQPSQDVKTFTLNPVAAKTSSLVTYSNFVHPGPTDNPQLHHTYASEPCSASLHSRFGLQGNICYMFGKVPDHNNHYPAAFPYGNGMVLHFYQQQESSTTKTVHKVINKRLKSVCIVASHW